MTSLNVVLPYVNTILSAPLANIPIVKSNNIVTAGGNNFIGPWVSTKPYVIGDYVTYGTGTTSQLFRCLVANTNVTPNPTNYTQAEWVLMTSNNAILNNPKYIQVSQALGNDTKAAQGLPIPFATIQAAVNYATDGSIIKLIGSNEQFVITSNLFIQNKTNLTIDGGLGGVYQTEGNTIIGQSTPSTNDVITIYTSANITIKNVIVSIGTNTSRLITSWISSNTVFDNVVFDTSLANTGIDISYSTGTPLNMGDSIIANCRSKTADPTQYLNVAIRTTNTSTGTLGVSRFFILNHIGPVGFGNSNITFLTAPLPVNGNFDNLFMYVDNCKNYIGNVSGQHAGFLSISNSIITTDFISTAASTISSNRLVISNTSLYNATNPNLIVNVSSCPRIFQNFTYNRTLANVLGGVSTLVAGDYTVGPARNFNRYGMFNNTILTFPLPGTPGNTPTLMFGTSINNDHGILALVPPVPPEVNYSELQILGAGTFMILIALACKPSLTDTGATAATCWIGPTGSTEATAYAVTTFKIPLSTVTFTNLTFKIPVVFTVTQASTTTYAFYARNLGPTTIANVGFNRIFITQIR